MYNLVSFIFLIAGIFSIGKSDFKWLVLIFAVSVGFALAGAIGSISETINNLFKKDNNTNNE